nr:hypothetical protein [Tanacetum cinerariifolium]
LIDVDVSECPYRCTMSKKPNELQNLLFKRSVTDWIGCKVDKLDRFPKGYNRSVLKEPSRSVPKEPSRSVPEEPSRSVPEEPSRSVPEEPTRSVPKEPSRSVLKEPI